MKTFLVFSIVLCAILLAMPVVAGAQSSPQSAQGQITTQKGTMEKARRVHIDPLAEPPQITPEMMERFQEMVQSRSNLPMPPTPVEAGIRPKAVMPERSQINAQYAAPMAPGDFMFYVNNDLGGGAPTNNTSVVNEPSVGNNGRCVFQSGNWYAALSTDCGQTFSFVDPYTTFPADAGGFCCDQIVIYDPSRDCLFWLLQYVHDGSYNNIQRLAVANSFSDIENQIWYYYDFTAQDLGLGSGYWLDFPDLVLGTNYLYLTSNYIWEDDDLVSGTSLRRLPLDDLAAGSGFTYNYYEVSDRYSFRCTHGAGTTMYWAAHNSTSSIRIYRLSEGSTTVFWDDVAVATWYDADCVAPGPDGLDWVGYADGRVLGAWLSNAFEPGGALGFMWTSSQGGGYPYPYVHVARFKVSDRSLINEPIMWNPDFAFAYPSVNVNARGHIAGSVMYGGGSNYPNCGVFIWDDYTASPPPGWEFYPSIESNSGPYKNRSGDYLSTRPHHPYSNTWIGTAFSMQGGSADSDARPRFLWFGRERDIPQIEALDLTYPGVVVQNVPFDVTVSALILGISDCLPTSCWIDFSANDPWVKLPQGDLFVEDSRTFSVVAPKPTDDLIIEVERVKLWDPELFVYARTNPIIVLGVIDSLARLEVTSPGGLQKQPFPVTVIPWHKNGDIYIDSVWIDLSASEPGVTVPHGDQLLVGPRTFTLIAEFPSDSLLIDAERVKIWNPDMIVYGRSEPITIIAVVDSLARLEVTSPGGMQNVPFPVTVTPWHLRGGIYTDSVWIDLSANEPEVILPQGDQLLVGPRTFTVIATYPSDSLLIDAERVKVWDPELIDYGRSDTLVILPAFIDQPDTLIVSDLPNDQGGYLALEWDYSDNHPGLGQFNTIDYYQIYRKIYPILDYQNIYYPWSSMWTCKPGYIDIVYEKITCSVEGYRARMRLVQEECGPPWSILNVFYYKWSSRTWVKLTPLEQPGNPYIVLSNTPVLYTFKIPDAALHPLLSTIHLRIMNLTSCDPMLLEVWIEEDAPQWFQYGTVAAPPVDRVPDPVGSMRIIIPDYGFPGTASDYFIQAVVTHIYPKSEGEEGVFVLDVHKVAGGVDESSLCGPAFGRSEDNIPPADPTDLQVIGNEVKWSLSPDDRLLHAGWDWAGNQWEIFGVTKYVIFRNGVYAGMVERGLTTWTNPTNTGRQYQVYAFDGTNLSKGTAPVAVQPTAYALFDNYPNPFNPETRIAYTLPEAAKVRVEVYNTLGQVVDVLVKNYQEPGYHVVVWEAGDIASGVYFYRLTANEFTATKRMLLMK